MIEFNIWSKLFVFSTIFVVLSLAFGRTLILILSIILLVISAVIMSIEGKVLIINQKGGGNEKRHK